VIEHVLNAGAELEAKDQYGATALIVAAAEGHTSAVTQLLKGKADVHAKDRNGWTALMWASSAGNVAVVEILKAHGAE
jgi:uncharacterized protein